MIPRILEAADEAKTLFLKASVNDPSCGFRSPSTVVSWKSRYDNLFANYLQPFLEDKTLLIATLLDSRYGMAALPKELAEKALTALKECMGREWDKQDRAQRAQQELQEHQQRQQQQLQQLAR